MGALAGAVTRDMYRYGKSRITRKRGRKYYRPRGYSRWKKARYSKRRRRYIGYPVRYGTAKRTLVDLASSQNVQSRTLYSRDITWLEHTASNDIDKRQRDMINLRGFRINLGFYRDTTASARDIKLHVAIIHDKGRANALLTQNNPVLVGDFFRGNGVNRAIDFQNSLAGIEVNSLGINTDLYTVLMKRVYLLKSPSQNGLASFNKRFYVKVNRQIRYDNETTTTEEPVATDGRCFLVWWAELAVGANAGATPILLGTMDRFTVTYWREPPC